MVDLGQTGCSGKYRVAVVQSAQYERRCERNCYVWSNLSMNLFKTSGHGVMKADTGDFVEVLELGYGVKAYCG